MKRWKNTRSQNSQMYTMYMKFKLWDMGALSNNNNINNHDLGKSHHSHL